MSLRPLSRRTFLHGMGLGFAAVLLPACSPRTPRAREDAPHLLLLSADDLGWDSPGFAGGAAPEITPQLDALAASGMRFDRAYVNVSACHPSRAALLTGLHPHRNGVTGFDTPLRPGVATLSALLAEAGYETALLGKEHHYQPLEQFRWGTVVGLRETRAGRDPAAYASWLELVIRKARSAGRPFFAHANSHDPHRPFHGSISERRMDLGNDAPYPPPSRSYAPEEVRLPGFLPDLPPVRQEFAQYCSSVRRVDDWVGALLGVLDAEGVRERTLVVFLSDNGMSFPFAKGNCWMASTRTPLLLSWPERIPAGGVDREHFVSGIDLTPTLLELVLPEALDGRDLDGRSFLSLLEGRAQPERERVVTSFHTTVDERSYEMRSLQRGPLGYIWNAWSDGFSRFQNESQSGLSMAAMSQAARSDPALAERLRHLIFRQPEELYDYEDDPGALRNLAGDPAHAPELAKLRQELLAWMRASGDPLAGRLQERLG